MVDFIKLKYRRTPLHDHRLQELGLFHNIDTKTGETVGPATSDYGPVKIKVATHSIIASIFLHHYYNSKTKRQPGNYNDLSHQNLCEAISMLDREFGIPIDARIQVLEFGVNLNDIPNVRDLLETKVIAHDFDTGSIRNDGFYYRCWTRSQFELKVYDKGVQSRLTSQILRVEIKMRKNAYMRRHASTTSLRCLTDAKKMAKLANHLLSELRKLQLADDPLKSPFILHACHPSYWKKHKRNKQRIKKALMHRLQEEKNQGDYFYFLLAYHRKVQELLRPDTPPCAISPLAKGAIRTFSTRDTQRAAYSIDIGHNQLDDNENLFATENTKGLVSG